MEDSLIDQLEALTVEQQAIVREVILSLRQTVRSDIHQDSDICSDDFVCDFQNRLLLYHALTEQPLTKKAFEYTLCKSFEGSGRSARIEANDVNSGADIYVSEIGRISLKTEGGKSINPEKIVISKFMEARWIRDCTTTNDMCDNTKDKFKHHLAEYDRIFTLRSFNDADNNSIEYRLVEIPKAVLESIQNLEVGDFSEIRASGSSSATVSRSGTKILTVALDGSVEKVTIRNLLVSECFTHGAWNIPIKFSS